MLVFDMGSEIVLIFIFYPQSHNQNSYLIPCTSHNRDYTQELTQSAKLKANDANVCLHTFLQKLIHSPWKLPKLARRNGVMSYKKEIALCELTCVRQIGRSTIQLNVAKVYGCYVSTCIYVLHTRICLKSEFHQKGNTFCHFFNIHILT